MVGKKKSVSGQKETSQADTGEEGKENREKGGEKDVARRRGGTPRKGRGASRGRECECLSPWNSSICLAELVKMFLICVLWIFWQSSLFNMHFSTSTALRITDFYFQKGMHGNWVCMVWGV